MNKNTKYGILNWHDFLVSSTFYAYLCTDKEDIRTF